MEDVTRDRQDSLDMQLCRSALLRRRGKIDVFRAFGTDLLRHGGGGKCAAGEGEGIA